MEWAAQGRGGVTVPGGVPGKTGCDTQSHGLVDKEVFGHRLGSMI